MFPNENTINVDLGTATTFCAINSKNEYLGGAIIPGLKISMKSLVSNTAKLPSVEILPKKTALGRSTAENIQSGLFWNHIGAIKEITSNLKNECFPKQDCKIIGTGGFTRLFKGAQLFDHIEPNLVLNGLFLALKLNS
jgi:type III pantothenate kinase